MSLAKASGKHSIFILNPSMFAYLKSPQGGAITSINFREVLNMSFW